MDRRMSMSINKPFSSRRSIMSLNVAEEGNEDPLQLTKRLNTYQYNDQLYFRNIVQKRYQSLPLLSPSCSRYSPEGLQHINNLENNFPGIMPLVYTQPRASEIFLRICTNRANRLLKGKTATDESDISLDSAKPGMPGSLAKKRDPATKTPDKFSTQLQQFTQDPKQSQFIKAIGENMQTEVPLPIMDILYKEVYPILTGVFQDYKKILGQPTEHFMTEDMRCLTAEVAARTEALNPS